MFSNEDSIIENLAAAGLVAPEEIDAARAKGGDVIDYLVSNSDLTSEQVAQTISANAGMDFIDIDKVHIEPAIINLIS
ncbi:MAG: hypothetical protein AAF514_18350, partial [Verrucomicrobiota bacterium]